MRGADPHRRPRLAPAGHRALHGALPHARRLRPGPDDARPRSRPSTACPPERYPELAALVGETSDNLPGIPGVGPGYAAKWINTYDGLDNVITHADEITGKKGEALRAHLGDVMRNRRLNAAGHATSTLELAPGDLEKRAVGPAGGAQRSSTAWSSGCCATGSSRRSTSEEVIEEGGFELDGAALGDGRGAGPGWPASTGPPSGVHVRGAWGAGTGRVDGLAPGHRRRRGGLRRHRRR